MLAEMVHGQQQVKLAAAEAQEEQVALQLVAQEEKFLEQLILQVEWARVIMDQLRLIKQQILEMEQMAAVRDMFKQVLVDLV